MAKKITLEEARLRALRDIENARARAGDIGEVSSCLSQSEVAQMIIETVKLQSENEKLKEKISVLEETIVHYKAGEKLAF